MYRLLAASLTLLCACSDPSTPDVLADVPADNAVDEDTTGIGGGSADFGKPTRSVILDGVPWTSQLFNCDSWNKTKTCGPTSLAMALSYVNKEPLVADLVKGIVEQLGLQWPCGSITNTTTLARYLDSRNVAYKARIFDADQLTAALDAGHPVVAPVYGQNFQTGLINLEKKVGHFMLIVGVTQNEIIANDPGRSLRANGEYHHFPLDNFIAAWWGDGKYKGIEIIGNPNACLDAARCNPQHGSCDPQSGSCVCAAGYAGSACDRCTTGYTGYPECKQTIPCQIYYIDKDGDGHGDKSQPGRCLTAPDSSYKASVNDDCNDADKEVYPGHAEWWDVRDNDCNGQIDEVGLTRLDRWHTVWGAEDWEHRFAASSPGASFVRENHWVKLYSSDVCSSIYSVPGCQLLSAGKYAEVRPGIQLAALGECSGRFGAGTASHATLYLLEDSTEFRDYSILAGFNCRRVGYVLASSALPAFSGSKGFYRLRSCFCAGGRHDNMWSTLSVEPDHPDYSTTDPIHWYAPDGF